MVLGPEPVYNSFLLTANCFLDALSLKIFSDLFSVKRSHPRCFFRIVIHDYWKLGIFISLLYIIIIKYSAYSVLNLIKICGKRIVFGVSGHIAEKLDEICMRVRVFTKLSTLTRNFHPIWKSACVIWNANAVFFPSTNYPFSDVRLTFWIVIAIPRCISSDISLICWITILQSSSSLIAIFSGKWNATTGGRKPASFQFSPLLIQESRPYRHLFRSCRIHLKAPCLAWSKENIVAPGIMYCFLPVGSENIVSLGTTGIWQMMKWR